jgi:hypothetical protein
MPISDNSFTNIEKWFGWNTSTTIKTKSAFLATERTFFPIPFPEAAPLMIPGKSMICIFAPLYSIIPGIAVSVVNW